ncbi:hypothetical protein YC2023_109600 [Brassica napus]
MVIFFSIDVSVNNIYRPEDKGNVIREVKEADAIILTFPISSSGFIKDSIKRPNKKSPQKAQLEYNTSSNDD